MKSFILIAVLSVSILGDVCFARKAARIRVRRSVDDLSLHVQTDDAEHHLNLKKPESSIFSSNFKLHLVSSDENGNAVFDDQTPSLDELNEAEQGVYVDPESDSAVHVSHEDGEYRITGHFNGQSISHEDGQHFVAEASKVAADGARLTDYVDPHRNVTPGRTTRIATSVTPELAIVLDNANYNQFKGDNNAMVTYLSLLVNSVNNRYANIADPKITFKVSGLQAISSTSAQPFITNSATPAGNAYDINKILDAFSKWVYSNSATLPKHDLSPLITGVHVQSKDSSGNYVDGVAGLAYLKGACWINGAADMGTSVNADAGGAYAGVNTLAHELAHNLGSPHDGEGDSAACPWSAGNIMSYEGYGKLSKFYFSSCSISTMNAFITSTGGTCLKTLQSSSQWTLPTTNAGDFMNMTTQCQLALNNPKAYVDLTTAPDDLCKNLKCKYPDATNPNSIWTTTLNRMPADASYCGESGTCTNGACVVQPNMTAQCQTATGKSNAYVDSTKSADSLCSNLVCKYPDATNPSTIYTVTTNKAAIDHSPCGRQGRCISNACSQPPPPVIPPSMTQQCVSATGKPKAYVEPNKTADELCTNLQCRYPDDTNANQYWMVSLNRPPADYTPCGTNGNCVKGKCIVGAV
jgi:hypothetical protein